MNEQQTTYADENLLIQVDFWLDNRKTWASRNLIRVPEVGDKVRFNMVAYEITYRIWFYDEKRPRVALNMTEIKRG